MNRKGKLRALAVAAAIAVTVAATLAAMLARSTGSERKSADADFFGHKVLEMLLCLPVTGCSAPKSSPSFSTVTGVA